LSFFIYSFIAINGYFISGNKIWFWFNGFNMNWIWYLQLSGDDIKVIFTSVKRWILNNTRVGYCMSRWTLLQSKSSVNTVNVHVEKFPFQSCMAKPLRVQLNFFSRDLENLGKRIRLKIIHFNPYRKAASKHEGQERCEGISGWMCAAGPLIKHSLMLH